MNKTSSRQSANQASARALPGLASVTLLTLVVTGCVSMPGKSTDSTVPDQDAAATARTANPAIAEPAGMRYVEVAAALKQPIERARQTLIGQQISVDLQRDTSKGAPANRYVVQAGDTHFFRCLSSAANFSGGPVTAEVRTVRMPASGATRTVELAYCASDGSPQASAVHGQQPVIAVELDKRVGAAH